MARSQPAYGVNQPTRNIFPSPVVAQRAPTSGDTRYEVGQLWVDKSTDQIYGLAKVASGLATWSVMSPGASDVDTITGDSGGALSPAAGNINIVGGAGITTSGAGSTLTITSATGYAPITQYVVDAGGSGDYTTVQAAVNAANGAGGGLIFIYPGTYTEDLTLYDNIYLMGASESATVLAGTHTPPASGDLNIWRMTLTDATAIFSSAAAGTTTIIVEDCTVTVTNGHMFDLANWAGSIAVFDLAATGANDGFINNTGGATVSVYEAGVGNGTGQSMTISGPCNMSAAQVGCPVTFTTGATTTNVDHSAFAQAVTLGGDSAGSILNSSINGGASAAVTMSSTGDWDFGSLVLDSSNNPALAGAGAGTLTISSVEFLDNGAISSSLTTSFQEHYTGTSLATTFDTNVAAAGVTLTGTTLAADGTDANISVTVTPKGTGTLTVNSGGILNSAGDVISTHSNAGADNTVQVTNSDNTDPASRAGFEAAVGGTSAGDPYVNFLISGGQAFTMGIDNSTTNDDFVISDAAALGTANRVSIDGSTGVVSIPTSDLTVTRAGGAGTAVLASVVNTDNTNNDSPAQVTVQSGGTSGGDAFALFQINGGQAFSVGVDNSATNDDFVISDNTALGTNNRISIDGSTGVVTLPTSDLTVTRAGGAGTAVLSSVINTDNTNSDSPAQVTVESGGTSGGDAFALFQINGGQAFSIGVDNSATNDDFVISDNSALGTNDRITIDGSTGDVAINQNLSIETTGKQLQVKGGAATDFIGQATLVAGTVTVANTNIAAGDRIYCTRSSVNGSTALGVLITSLVASTSFTITAVQPGTPAATETNDVSIVDYFIVRST